MSTEQREPSREDAIDRYFRERREARRREEQQRLREWENARRRKWDRSPDQLRREVEVTGLAEILMTLREEEQAIAFLAFHVCGASFGEIAQQLQIPRERVRGLIFKTASMLRFPSRSETLKNYLAEKDGPRPLIDKSLRALMRHWRIEELFGPMCGQCGERYEAASGQLGSDRQGRPRKYCSNACRQKAYRDRHR